MFRLTIFSRAIFSHVSRQPIFYCFRLVDESFRSISSLDEFFLFPETRFPARILILTKEQKKISTDRSIRRKKKNVSIDLNESFENRHFLHSSFPVSLLEFLLFEVDSIKFVIFHRVSEKLHENSALHFHFFLFLIEWNRHSIQMDSSIEPSPCHCVIRLEKSEDSIDHHVALFFSHVIERRMNKSVKGKLRKMPVDSNKKFYFLTLDFSFELEIKIVRFGDFPCRLDCSELLFASFSGDFDFCLLLFDEETCSVLFFRLFDDR